MSLNPTLIETIKGDFAKRPSAELRAILEARDSATMSEEAFAAAAAVLAERSKGNATEPSLADRDLPARELPDHAFAWGLVWTLRVLAALMTLCGGVFWFTEIAAIGFGKAAAVAIQAACAVLALLVFAEGLRLGILIEENTRRLVRPRN